MDTNVPLGPPELNKDPQPIDKPGSETPKTPTIQLIKSTQSKVMPVRESVEDEDENWLEPDELNEHVEEPGDPDGVFAAEQAQRYQEQHPESTPSTPKAKRRKKHRFLKFIIFLVLVAAAGYGAFWFGDHQAAKNEQPKKAATAARTKPKPTVAAPKQYTSDNFSLDFKYPADWAVQETAEKITVTSPSLQLENVAGSHSGVHVLVTIQNQQTALAGYPSGGATAVIASDKLTYVQPTGAQRAQTYLSYLGYTQSNGLDALFVTGDNGYLQGQNVPQSNVVQGNPLISVTFETCESDCGHGASPATLLAGDWKASGASKAVVDLLQSMQFN